MTTAENVPPDQTEKTFWRRLFKTSLVVFLAFGVLATYAYAVAGHWVALALGLAWALFIALMIGGPLAGVIFYSENEHRPDR